jgi:enhancing lycopene biosynthesis protein 2
MAGKKRIGVLLCGCGHRDGSEVHEATCTLLAIDRAGGEAVCFAPKGPQRFVRDHLTGKEASDTRDVLTESARIARGQIRDVALARVSDMDALIIPGGQGAALNLSTFLIDDLSGGVHPEVSRLTAEMVGAKKPVGAVCIAPATVGLVLRDLGIKATLTIGTDDKVASQIEQMGHRHEKCPATSCVVDEQNRIVTTPAYMNAKSIGEVWQGVEKLVAAVMEMA